MKNVTSGLSVGTLQELVDNVRIYHVENPKTDLYKDKDLKWKFDCTTNKKGQWFYDGNNGDLWRIKATNGTTRFYAENMTQNFIGLFYY